MRDLLAKNLNQKTQTHPDGSKERWRDVPGFEGYYRVSDRGRLKSLDRNIPNSKGPGCRTIRGQIIKQRPFGGGYRGAGMSKEGRGATFYVHRLVAMAFIPNPEKKPEVNHKDFDRANNIVDNLEWVTHKEQAQHAAAGGRMGRKLTAEEKKHLSEVTGQRMRNLSAGQKRRLYQKQQATRQANFTAEKWKEISKKGGYASAKKRWGTVPPKKYRSA